jgi:hypothetical protein
MNNLLIVIFEAHNTEKNHHHRYQVTVGRDLLDDWTVTISYGSTGKGGRELRYAASDADVIRSILRNRLRRRLSAPRRIGCPYRLAAFNAAPGLDAYPSCPVTLCQVLSGGVTSKRAQGSRPAPQPETQATQMLSRRSWDRLSIVRGIANTCSHPRSGRRSAADAIWPKKSEYFRPTFGQNIGLAYS